MRFNLTIIALIVFPATLFSQSVRLDTRGQLASFFKLSQNDFDIKSKSTVLTEKEAYIKYAQADIDTDGRVTYSEYLNYLNKLTPNSISKYDLALSTVLPLLKDFSFSTGAGTIGTGVLEKTIELLSGRISLSAGSKITIAKDALLIESSEGITQNGYTMKSKDGSLIVLPFTDALAVGALLTPNHIDIKQAQIELGIPKTLLFKGVPINDYIKNAIKTLYGAEPVTAENLTTAFNDVLNSELYKSDISGLALDKDTQAYIDAVRKNTMATLGNKRMANKMILQKIYPGVFVDQQFYLLRGQLTNTKILKEATTLLSKEDIVREVLNDTWQWFHTNPPAADGSNFDARREHSAILDQLGVALTSDPWVSYLVNFENNGYAPAMRNDKSTVILEKQNPLLYYLRLSEEKTLEEIRTTTITQGVRIWKMYNMGIIVKTPDKCFAIDLKPITTNFTNVLEFTIISHNHPDHWAKGFIDAMAKAGKPIYSPSSRSSTGRTFIDQSTTLQQGPLTVSFSMSSQWKPGTIDYAPCLITTVDCGASTGNFKIMHTGDAMYPIDFPVGHVDFFDASTTIWRTQDSTFEEILKKIMPTYINLDHIMEFGHTMAARGHWRAIYDEAYEEVQITGLLGSMWGLTWGESLFFTNK
jgi:hypothetical protein